MEYEFIREIFNSCSGNQMRDVFVEEIKTFNVDEYLKQFLVGENVEVDKNVLEDGTIIFDVNTDGMRQRFSFSAI